VVRSERDLGATRWSLLVIEKPYAGLRTSIVPVAPAVPLASVMEAIGTIAYW
jgi:hypothetical protein